ncbi:hypothetical protein Moror_13606 [Moniliophthora roreri MCA 2997]|uniref:Uncharacterized protein n=1 Tax=Moniliophthora roreri (strain MCA 2997) TaxID=1381753 RepID=V2X9L0_MONRO|nr:hypothetical protein Moror_13606 [Moniliophthora roreri MCA 2997]
MANLRRSPIRIIATARAATGLSRGTALLAGAPYSLEPGDLQNLLAIDMYYAGTDALRTRRLLNALDEEVGALWAARDASLAPYATFSCADPYHVLQVVTVQHVYHTILERKVWSQPVFDLSLDGW